MNTFGIIIQGPLISSAGQIPGNPVKYFDTTETILENYRKIKLAGGVGIVSTWEPQTAEERGVAESLRERGIPTITSRVPAVLDPDHRYKQRFGVLVGIHELEKKFTPMFLVKIRTDMLMPESFWQWVNEISRIDSRKLYVSEITRTPFFMGDFIYAASDAVFSDFINCIIDFGPEVLHPVIGIDDGMKYAHYKKFLRFQSMFQSLYTIYLSTLKEKLLLRTWNNFTRTELETIPKKIWLGIVWRGHPISFFIKPENFKFNTLPEKFTKTNFKEKIKRLNILLSNYEICFRRRGRSPLIVKLYAILKKLKALGTYEK